MTTAKVTPISRRGSKPGTRRPTRRSKEQELRLFVMQLLDLTEKDVLYERNNSFDLELPGNVFLERTQADTFAKPGVPGKRRHLAVASLARKYRQAAAFEKAHPGSRVWVVTDAEWELLQLNPNRLFAWLGRKAPSMVA